MTQAFFNSVMGGRGSAPTGAAPQRDQGIMDALRSGTEDYGALGRGLYDSFTEHALPTFARLNEGARNFDSRAYADRLAGQASAQGALSQQQAIAAQNRDLASRGVNPNSGASRALGLQAATQNAANTAAARTNAYTQADQMGFERLAAAAGQNQVLSNAAAQAGGLGQAYAGTLGNYDSAYGQMATQVANANTNARVQAETSRLNAGLGALQLQGDFALGMGDLANDTMDSVAGLYNAGTLGQYRANMGLNSTAGTFFDQYAAGYNTLLNGNQNVVAAHDRGGLSGTSGADRTSQLAAVGEAVGSIPWEKIFASKEAAGATV